MIFFLKKKSTSSFQIEQLENDLQQSQDREKKLRKQVHILKGDYGLISIHY